jgi:hypothetical protein
MPFICPVCALSYETAKEYRARRAGTAAEPECASALHVCESASYARTWTVKQWVKATEEEQERRTMINKCSVGSMVDRRQRFSE